MTGETRKQEPRPKRAQAIVELAVFGSIFIFIMASIFQQGYGAMIYQQSLLQPMRMALLKSYLATDVPSYNPITGQVASKTYKYSSVSIFYLQDRLSPGDVKNYGISDRRPYIMTGGGTLNKGLMYPLDWVDVADDSDNAIGVTDVTVNGQRFQFTSAAAYWQIIRRAGPQLFRSHAMDREEFMQGCYSGGAQQGMPWQAVPVSAERGQRIMREWPAGNEPVVYSILANGNKGWSDSNSDDQYNTNRNDPLIKDDLWLMSGTLIAERQKRATWKWLPKTMSIISLLELKQDDTKYVLADVNGDGMEESVYSIHYLTSTWYYDGCGDVMFARVVDSQAGDIAGEDIDGWEDKRDIPGLKSDAEIYTKLGDGTILQIISGKAYDLSTNALSTSIATKNQYDVVSREWQLNQNMTFPETFAARQNAANPGAIEAQCGDPMANPKDFRDQESCCTEPDKVLRTCFDLTKRSLFIRSRIEDKRGRQWINRSEPTTINSIFAK